MRWEGPDRVLPPQLGNTLIARALLALQDSFVLGSTWTRCPTPPCASRRHCDSIYQFQLLAESSASPSPSLMDAPCPKVWPHNSHSISTPGGLMGCLKSTCPGSVLKLCGPFIFRSKWEQGYSWDEVVEYLTQRWATFKVIYE